MCALSNFQLISDKFGPIEEAIRSLFSLCVYVYAYATAVPRSKILTMCKSFVLVSTYVRTYVRTYVYRHTYADFTFSYFFGVYDMLQLPAIRCCDVYFVVFYGHGSHTPRTSTMDTDGSLHCPASRWSQVWYGKIIPCRAGGSQRGWSRNVQAVNLAGRGVRINFLGAPVEANQRGLVTLPAQVESMEPIPYRVERKQSNSHSGGHPLDDKSARIYIFKNKSWTKHRSWRAFLA